MSEALKLNKGLEEGVLDLLTKLLDAGSVSGVFTLTKTNQDGAVAYSLITSGDILKQAAPFEPLMPVNAGRVLSTFTWDRAAPKPIAAVLRPCEIRAFMELVKRSQGSLENIVLISLTCGGVYPLKSLHSGHYSAHRSSYLENMEKAVVDPNIRSACKNCVDFVPYAADIIFTSVGSPKIADECTLILNTKKGIELGASIGGRPFTTELENDSVNTLKKSRSDGKKLFLEDYDKNRKGQEGLIKTFAACLGCHACSEACPICSCLLCTFDSKTCQYNPENILTDLDRKGGIKVPAGNLFFHIGRMSHMAVSCVKCGMCTDVCPVNIPVADVFCRVGESLQDVFEYDPGQDVTQAVPSGTYKEDEFVEIGEQ